MHNKTVLITGASRGIGRSTAKKFISEGYNVIIICKNDISRMNDLKQLADTNNLICLMYECDVSSYEAVTNIFNDIHAKNINIDIVVNNAGISHVGLLQDMTVEEWNSTINTNLSSVFYICKNVIPGMLKKHNGKIINISSIWGIVGASCEVAYSTTKGGVNLFTKALAKELAPSNIQVNAIACGVIDTDMNSHLSNEDKQNLEAEIPTGRMGTPDEIANIIYDIANSGEYMTGQIITVDGGFI
ncbi:MAG: 3-oxoacyl-ACP reductase FabG [Lachnospiraceae bacterium]|nr:3-oxoacyl-ACP reductase FabG [Lachnospiraceae bacterium]